MPVSDRSSSTQHRPTSWLPLLYLKNYLKAGLKEHMRSDGERLTQTGTYTKMFYQDDQGD